MSPGTTARTNCMLAHTGCAHWLASKSVQANLLLSSKKIIAGVSAK